MIQAWFGLNLVFIIMIIAIFGFWAFLQWHLAICMVGFAVTAILGMKLMKNIDEEQA